MSLSVAELKKVSLQSIRDISAGLRAKAASLRATKAGLSDLPHKGTWTGVAADNADHEIGTFAKGVSRDADAYEDAARKIDRAGDEFEGVKQLLSKLENEAAGKFAIDEATGEVTPLTKDFNKSDRDYIASTIKQLCAAGGQANDDLAAGIHATGASGATSPASSDSGPLPLASNSSIKPDGVVGGIQNLAAPNPDGDPAATKAAATATAGSDTINYKELYPKNSVPVGDKTVDSSKLGGLGAIPGVRDSTDKIPQPLAPRLADKDVPAFKDITRQNLQRQGVPTDQIEAKINAAVDRAQTPHFLPDAPSASPTDPSHLSRSPGERFIDFTNDVHEGFYQSADGAVQQGKELAGQAGPGAPGVAEAWGNLAKDSGRALFEQTVNPIGSAIDQAQQAINDPGHFAGHKLFEATALAPTLPLGGESAALARGLEGGAIERGLFGDISHLDDGGGHHSNAGGGSGGGFGGDHSGGVGDHGGGPGGHGMPGGNPTPFNFDNPIDTARPEFNIPNPIDVMSPELRGLAEQHLAGSGETVLGPYRHPIPGGPSYIDVAGEHGASYFDIGDAWNRATPMQQLAANQHVLDMAIANRDTIRLSVSVDMIKQDTFTGAELRYLQSHGYEIASDGRSLTPPRAGG